MTLAHPELSVDGDHGEEQHHGQRAPEVRVVPHHLPVEAEGGHRHQNATDLVVDVLQINVQLFTIHKNTQRMQRSLESVIIQIWLYNKKQWLLMSSAYCQQIF